AAEHDREVHVRAAADAGGAELGEDGAAGDAPARGHEADAAAGGHPPPTAGGPGRHREAVPRPCRAAVRDEAGRGGADVPADVARDVDREVVAAFAAAVATHEATVGDGPLKRTGQAVSAGGAHPTRIDLTAQELLRDLLGAEAEAARVREG